LDHATLEPDTAPAPEKDRISPGNVIVTSNVVIPTLLSGGKGSSVTEMVPSCTTTRGSPGNDSRARSATRQLLSQRQARTPLGWVAEDHSTSEGDKAGEIPVQGS